MRIKTRTRVGFEFTAYGHEVVYKPHTGGHKGGLLIHKKTGELMMEYMVDYSSATIRKDAQKWLIHREMPKIKVKRPRKMPFLKLGQGSFERRWS
jgi:hypothetical protein